jgi:phosphomannomutase
MKRLIIFDLDGTLAKSKSALDPEMVELLHRLLGIIKVAVISGGDWSQFQTQLISKLPSDERLANLSVLPTCGTKFLVYNAGWKELYAEDLSTAEKQKIIDALQRARAAAGAEAVRVWGEVIEDRASQITFSALGQAAPLDAKAEWDPEFVKRKQMKTVLDTLIPEFSVRLGGMTSIDVTKLGIDKAYGIRKLREVLDISLQEMLFVGDALFVGGNDYPAREAGVDCIQVRDPEETKRIIETLVACLEPAPSALGRPQ